MHSCEIYEGEMRQKSYSPAVIVDTGFWQMWIFVTDFGFPCQEVTIPPEGCGGIANPSELD